MSSGNRLFDPNSGMHAQAPHHWNRRDFVKGVAALAGTAGISVYDMKTAAAEPSPEKTNLTLIENPVTCIVPTYIAAELLHAEGFTDVRFRKFPSETKLWPPDGLASGEFDIALTFIPTDIVQIDSGSPIVVLAGSHTGCVELVASNRVRTTKDLRGRTIGFDTDTKNFVAMFAAYVGINPNKDVDWRYAPYRDHARLLMEGQIDAFMSGPPASLELRKEKFGHVLVDTTTDKPWSQYFCCLIATSKEFVRKYPVATKRALRAFLKSSDVCAEQPQRVARLLADRGLASYENNLQMLSELPFGRWREFDPEASMRFFALRMHELGIIRSTPQKIITQGADWRSLRVAG